MWHRCQRFLKRTNKCRGQFTIYHHVPGFYGPRLFPGILSPLSGLYFKPDIKAILDFTFHRFNWQGSGHHRLVTDGTFHVGLGHHLGHWKVTPWDPNREHSTEHCFPSTCDSVFAVVQSQQMVGDHTQFPNLHRDKTHAVLWAATFRASVLLMSVPFVNHQTEMASLRAACLHMSLVLLWSSFQDELYLLCFLKLLNDLVACKCYSHYYKNTIGYYSLSWRNTFPVSWYIVLISLSPRPTAVPVFYPILHTHTQFGEPVA